MQPHEIIEKINKSEQNLYVTITTPENTSTFARDNWEHFMPWCSVQLAKLRNPDRDFFLSIVVRVFTNRESHKPGIPIKYVAGCLLGGDNGVVMLSQEQMCSCMETSSETGEPLPPMTDLEYKSFEEMLEII